MAEHLDSVHVGFHPNRFLPAQTCGCSMLHFTARAPPDHGRSWAGIFLLDAKDFVGIVDLDLGGRCWPPISGIGG